jgi:hypothetical protein
MSDCLSFILAEGGRKRKRKRKRKRLAGKVDNVLHCTKSAGWLQKIPVTASCIGIEKGLDSQSLPQP